MTITVSGTSITFNDATVQTTAGGPYTGARGQVFASSGTFTIPTGVSALKVTVQGGGGGAGGVPCVWYVSGAPGASAIVFLTGLTAGNTLTVTVGAGGSGNSNGNSGAGGTSRISSGTQTITQCQCTGGSGATSAGNTPGTATGGSLNFNGSTLSYLTLLAPGFNRGYGYGGYGDGTAGGPGLVLVEW
jgi:hypothetical protein